MATISKLKPGDVHYDVRSQKMGNMPTTTMACWTVRVIEVHERHIIASWNGNTPRHMNSMAVQKLRVIKPVMVDSGLGRKRLATRAELKAMKEAKLCL